MVPLEAYRSVPGFLKLGEGTYRLRLETGLAPSDPSFGIIAVPPEHAKDVLLYRRCDASSVNGNDALVLRPSDEYVVVSASSKAYLVVTIVTDRPLRLAAPRLQSERIAHWPPRYAASVKGRKAEIELIETL